MTQDRKSQGDNKARYRRLCAEETSIPIFLRDWWLDAMCGEDAWGVALAANKQEILGALPFYRRRIWGFTYLGHPHLTRRLGPWLRPRQAKNTDRLSYEKDVLTALIDDLPRFDLYRQLWCPEVTNWLPFYWRGFTETTRYTYVIDDLGDRDRLWSGLRENIRTDIRKAAGRFGVKVRRDLGVAEFFELCRKTFARQGLELNDFSLDDVARLDNACAERGCRAILIGEDGEGRRHAGVYVVWDENSAYYILGGGDPALRNSGATSLCVWEAMLLAAQVTKRFDFEGSMAESVERYFRAFGGRQTPYFFVTKVNSPLLDLGLRAQSFAGRLRR